MTENPFEIPQSMRDLAEQNLKQAHAAYGRLTDFMSQAMNAWMGALPADPMAIGFKTVQDHTMEFVTRQTQFAQDCIQAFVAQTQQLYSKTQEASEKSEHGAMGALPSNTMVTGFKDVRGRVVEMAKKNAESASALIEKSANAQDTREILILQTKFVQEQMQAFVAQSQELYRQIEETLQRSARG